MMTRAELTAEFAEHAEGSLCDLCGESSDALIPIHSKLTPLPITG